MNESLALRVLEELRRIGVVDLAVCPGARNASFIRLLHQQNRFNCFYWFEERSAAFFALGKTKVHERPAGVMTTSGTAAGELYPAAMEAYYSGNPLVLITADRPRRFRGSGAPQTAEQAGMFGIYAIYSQDIAGDEACDLSSWTQTGPAHLNVCFEDPLRIKNLAKSAL